MIAATNKVTRERYPMSCRAYDLYWAAKTPADEDVAKLLIAITRHLEGRGDVDPIDGTRLPTRRRRGWLADFPAGFRPFIVAGAAIVILAVILAPFVPWPR